MKRLVVVTALVVAPLASAPAAQAQQLLTLVRGVGEAASVGDQGPSIGPVPTAVQVDLALLRAAPLRLEVPTPDGSVLSAERSVFEDRGGGDLMWSGGQPGAGYDTVVLTVEGGRLVGRFGAAGGGVYQIHAERDGRGGMAPIVGAEVEAWCGVEADTEDSHDVHAHGLAEVHAADPPEPVSNPQSHDRLDILVLYTATAAENWADRGGALAAIRHAGDYLKMVFRNNDLPVEPHIVHVAQASTALDRAGRVLDRHDQWRNYNPLHKWMFRDGDLLRLRHEHRADLVHVFTGEPRHLLRGACGSHHQLRKGETARDFFTLARGWTTNYPGPCPDYAVTFAHEIGHGLGAHHDRANLVGFASNTALRKALESLFRPDSFGYPNFDVMPSLGTAMSYPGQTEPFFSTPRIRPWGAAVGITDEADNERTLRETVHIGARYSDYLRSLDGVPAAPSGLQVRFGAGAASLSWQDNAPEADGYEVAYLWESEYVLELQDRELSGQRILAVEGRTGATLPLEYTKPGSLYRFEVRAIKGEVRSLRSSEVWLVIPGEPIAAPSDVTVAVASGLHAVDVRWTDNSDNESAFEVQLLKDGEPIQRHSYYRPDVESGHFSSDEVQAQAGAEYAVRVFAYNSSGYSASSEEVTFRWQHPLAPGPVADVAATAIGPTTVRVTWTPDPQVERYRAIAVLRGWDHSRRWYPPRDGPASAAWVDFEGLPRGGRYKFSVEPWGGLGSDTFLTLGERGPGPEAPSDLSWAREEGSAVLSWKDNSSDELGFEVQSAPIGTEFWDRKVTVPRDTESVDYSLLHGHAYRVFAYNDRGFSLSSPRVAEPLTILSLTAASGATEVTLAWQVEFAETVTGMQMRWKAVADLPFDDVVDVWTDLPASAREYTVTGLRNGTEYAFAVRAAAAWATGFESIVWATPRDPPAPPRARLEASFTVSADCSDNPCRVHTGEKIRFTDTSTGDVMERHWSFGDSTTSDLKSPTHAWSTPGFYDVTLTVNDGSASDSARRTVLVEAAAPAGSCRFDSETLCLQDSRFEVKVDWWSADGEAGLGRVVHAGTNDSGMFQFFGPENWEILIKVLDGCRSNGRMWVLGAATTDLGYRIVVTDTVTGESRSYVNESGQRASAIVDTEAFSSPCSAEGLTP